VSSAATLDIVLTSFTGYRGLMFVLSNFIPATDGDFLQYRVSTNGGSSYDSGASDYTYTNNSQNDSGTTGTNNSAGAAFCQIGHTVGVGNASSEGITAVMELFGQTNAAIEPRILGRATYHGNTNDDLYTIQHGGRRVNAQDTDAMQFFFSSGNIASGSWALYGYV
jgi:hypothetical protein